jgi:hypothetical protein
MKPDTPDRLTEQRLRSALRSRAERVEPSPDAYARLATRVAASAPTARRWPSARLAVTAAIGVLVAAAGAAAFLLSGDGGGHHVDTAAPTTTAAPATTEPAGPPATDTGPATTEPPTTAPSPPPLAFPGADLDRWYADPADAGRDFASTILGEPDLVLDEPTDGRIPVRLVGEDGIARQVVGHLVLAAATHPDGTTRYGVAAAEADTITIDQPAPGSVVADLITVSGRATAFEATLMVAVRSLDGTPLGDALAHGGAGPDLEPYRVEVPVRGSGTAFVVVTAGSGASGPLSRHAAVPVRLDGTAPAARYAVARVAVDDPDGGLVVRAGPRASAERVGVLAPAATGIIRTGAPQGRWWPVTDGTVEGWVNSTYLTPYEPLDAMRRDELAALAARFAAAVEARDAGALAALPWADDVPVLFGPATSPETLTGSALGDPPFWTSARPFLAPSGVVHASFFDHVGPVSVDGIGIDDCCHSPTADRAEVRAVHHASLRSGPGAAGPSLTTRLYAEWRGHHPAITALLIEIRP